jgi:hypothetical protein
VDRLCVGLPQVIAVAKIVAGWAQGAGTVRFEVSDLGSSTVEVPRIRSFETGLHVYGTGQGNVHNTYILGPPRNKLATEGERTQGATPGSRAHGSLGGRRRDPAGWTWRLYHHPVIDAAHRSRLERELRRWVTTPVVVLAFTTVLYYSYKLKVTPLYAYQGLTYRPPETDHYAFAVALVVLVALVLPHRVRHTSDFILWLLFTMGGAPAILLPQFMATLPRAEADRLGLVVGLCMIMVRALTSSLPTRGWSAVRPSVPSHLVWYGMAVFAVANYGFLIITSGISVRWVDLSAGYDIREDFATATTGSLLDYTLPWLFNVVNPTLMARGIYSGRRLIFTLGAVGQYVVFASTGQKSVLFSIPGAILVALLFRWRSRPRGIAILGGLSGGALVTLSLDQLLGGTVWTSLFVRRFMIVPGALVAGFISVFHNQPKLWFSSVYGGSSPYFTPPTHLVGKLVGGDATTNANVSLFGDGYLQAGYLGVFIEGLVLVALLWAANIVTRGLPKAVTSVVFFMPTIALASGSITTVIFTHGFGFALLLCAVLPRTGWGRTVIPRSRSTARLMAPRATSRSHPALPPHEPDKPGFVQGSASISATRQTATRRTG